MKKTDRHLFPLIIAAFACGIVTGLLGAGGGVIVTLTFAHYANQLFDDKRDIFANTLCVVLPVSVAASVRYMTLGYVGLKEMLPFALPAVIGGLLGGFLLKKFRAGFVNTVFALITVWSGVYMLMK